MKQYQNNVNAGGFWRPLMGTAQASKKRHHDYFTRSYSAQQACGSLCGYNTAKTGTENERPGSYLASQQHIGAFDTDIDCVPEDFFWPSTALRLMTNNQQHHR